MKLRDALARLEGVRPCGDYLIARCPAHDDRTPSLSVRAGERGEAWFRCFAGCDYEAIIAALGGQPVRSSFEALRNLRPADDAERQRRNKDYARRIWRESQPAAGTQVAAYLRTRGITVQIPPSLRFHPSLRHPSGIRLPAMVARVDDRSGNFVAIHRTYLSTDGTKASVAPVKASLGPVKGGCVRLAPIAEKMGVAEGLETALSVQQSVGLPMLVALSAPGIEALQLPSGITELIVCVDGDRTGERAAERAGKRLLSEYRRLTVKIARPGEGLDFNDLLRRAHGCCHE